MWDIEFKGEGKPELDLENDEGGHRPCLGPVGIADTPSREVGCFCFSNGQPILEINWQKLLLFGVELGEAPPAPPAPHGRQNTDKIRLQLLPCMQVVPLSVRLRHLC